MSGIPKREAKRVLVEPVVAREMVRRLETTARVESDREVTIFPRLAGVVIELSAEEGQVVQEGEVLARLDDRDARIALYDAKAALVDAQANLPKLELAIQEAAQLVEAARLGFEQADRDHLRNTRIATGASDQPGLISQKDLDASKLARDQKHSELSTANLAWQRAKLEAEAGKAALERASLAVERSELSMSFLQITAPLTGVIASRAIKIGDSVSSGGGAFVLTDPNLLRVVFYRPQRELSFFQRVLEQNGYPAGTAPTAANGNGRGLPADGLEINAKAEALAGLEFRGTIERIAPVIDPASGNFRVTGRMQVDGLKADGQKSGRLLPGMLLRLEIVTERRHGAICVPKRALKREGDLRSVFLVDAGHARRVEVIEGLSDDEFVEVSPRLDEARAWLVQGAQVIVVGNRDLEDGALVQIETPQASAQ